MDVAAAARTLVRWVLTVGAAVAFAVLVTSICVDVWIGTDPVEVESVLGAVTISVSVTFGSAFVGWFGLSSGKAGISFAAGDSGWTKAKRFTATVFTTVAGAALFAMLVYLAFGAFAGATYVFNVDETPTVIIAVATAWAAQASAVIASTLATALTP